MSSETLRGIKRSCGEVWGQFLMSIFHMYAILTLIITIIRNYSVWKPWSFMWNYVILIIFGWIQQIYLTFPYYQRFCYYPYAFIFSVLLTFYQICFIFEGSYCTSLSIKTGLLFGIQFFLNQATQTDSMNNVPMFWFVHLYFVTNLDWSFDLATCLHSGLDLDW